ncbi:hypothetical protein CTI12_AA366050 [Artemisia annua]|uniref:Helitron helicase-like domain-containing protein n=1 Tax=Artemisia annua TaxID=35608 RepID=A0A2U1MLZ1_ARTAN|nr:hypothetical protein CTI12_AA366050 [Artemisia annua]
MRTKQKARPRVSSFDPLEPAVEGTNSYSIDIEDQGLVKNVHDVSKRLCTSSHVTSAICTDVGTVRHENLAARVIPDNFDVTSGCVGSIPVLPSACFQHATPVISEQRDTTNVGSDGYGGCDALAPTNECVAGQYGVGSVHGTFRFQQQSSSTIDLCQSSFTANDLPQLQCTETFDAVGEGPSTNGPHHSTQDSCHLRLPSTLNATTSSSTDTVGTENLNLPLNRRRRRSQVTMHSSVTRSRQRPNPRSRPVRSRQGPPDTYNYIGKCDQLCHHCNARFWYDERLIRARRGPPEYHKCCNAGKNLIQLLDDHNELVQLFRTARDKMEDADVPEFKVRLYGIVGSRQHELPTGDSIGAIVFEGGPDVETDFDVIIEKHTRQLQRVNKLNASYMSLQFPLIFFFGEDGYHLGRVLLGRHSTDDPPKKMSMKMYYSLMEETSSIVASSESKGKEIIAQSEEVSLANIKPSDIANEEPKTATPINAMPSLSISDIEPSVTATPPDDQATPSANQSLSSEQPATKKEAPRKTAKRALFTETDAPTKPSTAKKSKNQD